jgi:hypothetical protein
MTSVSKVRRVDFGDCGPPQPPKAIHSENEKWAAFQPRSGRYLEARPLDHCPKGQRILAPTEGALGLKIPPILFDRAAEVVE